MILTSTKQLRNIDSNCKIIIRSTIILGTSKRLGCSFMPEFLTEKNANDDFKKTSHWILGTDDTRSLVEKLLLNDKITKI